MQHQIKQSQFADIAQRICTLREIMEIPVAEIARETGLSAQEYLDFEQGKMDDISFMFLYNCAQVLNVDIVELLTGEPPKLTFYSIVRKGNGLKISRRKGFTYQHLAYRFTDKIAEPFLVTAPFREEEQEKPIEVSAHEGQEFDFVISGQLKVKMEDHEEYLGAGDAIYYDSGHEHGMIATGGEDCVILAIVMKDAHQKGERQG